MEPDEQINSNLVEIESTGESTEKIVASNKSNKKEESTSRRSRTESLRLGSGGQTQGLAFILGLHSRRLSLSQVYRGSAISILGVSICCTLGFAPNICGYLPHLLLWIKKGLQMAFFKPKRRFNGIS